MDPNLYVRFMIPAWVGIIAAFMVNWALGGDWLTEVTSLGEDLPWVAIAALLASPALGFVLNTFVVATCHARKVGPEYGRTLDDFKKLVLKVVDRGGLGRDPALLKEALGDMRAASVVAHFEYRTDTSDLLQWRRRQRAFFFLDWATVLAIGLGILLGLTLSSTISPFGIALSILMVAEGVLVYREVKWKYLETQYGDKPDVTARRYIWHIVLAVLPLVLVALPFFARPLSFTQQANLAVAVLALAFLSCCLAYTAAKSEHVAEEEQHLWAEFWTDRQIAEFLRKYGTGFHKFPKERPAPKRKK